MPTQRTSNPSPWAFGSFFVDQTRSANVWHSIELKYDLRDWSPEHAKMGKGITLTEEELRSLKVIIDKEIELLDADMW